MPIIEEAQKHLDRISDLNNPYKDVQKDRFNNYDEMRRLGFNGLGVALADPVDALRSQLEMERRENSRLKEKILTLKAVIDALLK